MKKALEISRLRKTFPGFTLNDVSFSLPCGQIMGLIGPNGAGKSTILKTILGVYRPDQGEIRIFGEDLDTSSKSIKKKIGFVHEVPRFYSYLTLEALRAIVAPFYPQWDEAKFQELAQKFGLPLDRKFGRLSRGMKMKAALALALSHNADLLVLDEPGSGLDPVFRTEFLDLLRRLMNDESKAVLLSSQITSDVERISDRVTYLRKGEVVFSSSMDSIRDSWGLVKGGPDDLSKEEKGFFRGISENPYGFQALTDNAPEARRRFADRVLVERASLEDIVFLMENQTSPSWTRPGKRERRDYA